MSEQKWLTADEIDAANDAEIEFVDVPEWGGGVGVRTMSAAGRDSVEAAITGGQVGKLDITNIRARFLVKCLCDSAGTLLYQDSDAARLGARSSQVIDRLWQIARRINRMLDSDLEELAKNSAAGRPDALPSS